MINLPMDPIVTLDDNAGYWFFIPKRLLDECIVKPPVFDMDKMLEAFITKEDSDV